MGEDLFLIVIVSQVIKEGGRGGGLLNVTSSLMTPGGEMSSLSWAYCLLPVRGMLLLYGQHFYL